MRLSGILLVKEGAITELSDAVDADADADAGKLAGMKLADAEAREADAGKLADIDAESAK